MVRLWGLRVGLYAGLWMAGAVASGCTKVREQPPAPAPAEALEKRPRPADAYRTRRPLPPARALPPGPTRPTFTTHQTTKLTGGRPEGAGTAITTLNGDPNGLRREDLSRTLDAALPSLAGCVPSTGGPSSIGLTFEADPSGKATNVKVSGAGPEVERCVFDRIAGLRLPTFSGAKVPVQFPLSVQRAAAAAPSNAAATSGSEPGLFIKP